MPIPCKGCEPNEPAWFVEHKTTTDGEGPRQHIHDGPTTSTTLPRATPDLSATRQQPAPTKTNSAPVVHYVIKDILARADLGLDRYGAMLQADNGRDHLVDAYQEALDLACYLRAELLRRDGK